MRELFGIMNLLKPDEWREEEDFYERYGGDTEVSTVQQIQALQVRALACCHNSCSPFLWHLQQSLRCHGNGLRRNDLLTPTQALHLQQAQKITKVSPSVDGNGLFAPTYEH